jgi:O-antigen/teichoic acid export membrane protein
MPTNNKEANKRIAKNTLMLYIRMFFTMAVSLFTSRVILQTLGVTDYGINNVVGGVVTMFSFLNGAMASATQRYLNVDIAQGNKEHLRTTFRTAMQIHVLIALAIFVLAETVGLWFVLNKLIIPEERMHAAMWVYQFSIVASMVGIISLPYNADIIAHERMSAFAYISMMDVILKLVIVYMLVISPFDKLITYSALFLGVNLLDRFIYNFYCKRHFEEVNFSLKIEKKLFKEMSSFAGWSLWGNIAAVLFTQGLNMLLNMFFGPAVNAARGIAVQVQGVIQGFVANVQTAVNPQITKSYAQNNLPRMHKLMFASSKFCFYLLFLMVLPLSFEAHFVLQIWLGIVPDHTVWFLRLIMFIMLTETLANPYIVANQATGKVKVYQAICGGLLLMIVPIAYIVLKLGGNPESVYVVHGCIAIITQIARVYMMRNLINLPMMEYFKKVVMPILLVAVTAFIFPFILHNEMNDGVARFFAVCSLSVVCALASAYFIGTNKYEKDMILDKVHAAAHKFHKK